MDGTGWFTEADLPLGRGGLRLQVRVDRILHDEVTPYGHVQIFDSEFHGRFLALDGIIQVAEKDEYIYHEFMVTLPGLLHGSPERILILGGGDGGAVRQATRFPSVRRIVQAEIDDTVTLACREYLPSISDGAFDDPRVELITADAFDYVADTDEEFDLIVLDLTDPVPDGPAARLFEESFYASVRSRLAAGGIMSLQCGSLIFQLSEVVEQIAYMKAVYPFVQFRQAVIPSYQLTSFGFLYGSAEPLPAMTEQVFDKRSTTLTGQNQFVNYPIYLASSALAEDQKEFLT